MVQLVGLKVRAVVVGAGRVSFHILFQSVRNTGSEVYLSQPCLFFLIWIQNLMNSRINSWILIIGCDHQLLMVFWILNFFCLHRRGHHIGLPACQTLLGSAFFFWISFKKGLILDPAALSI